jgi:hypothetical protein
MEMMGVSVEGSGRMIREMEKVSLLIKVKELICQLMVICTTDGLLKTR